MSENISTNEKSIMNRNIPICKDNRGIESSKRQENMSSNRVEGRKDYLDVLKFIGIFSIYLGHMADSAGDFYPFVFMYHVPLFFFLSGCTETLSRKRSFPEYIRHKAKTILLPWLFFAIASIAVYIICFGTAFSLSDIANSCIQILQGCVRNRFLAGSLWFFTCLFVISIAFRLIEKWNKILILLICCLVYLIAQFLLPQSLPGEPQWYWNADSAMYYMFYYCVGYLLFPVIDRILNKGSRLARGILTVVWIGCFYYTILCFYGSARLSAIWALPYLGTLVYYAQAVVIILFFLGLAWLLRNVDALRKIGKDTLYLCGNEMFIKLLLPALAGIIGIEISLGNQLETIAYVAIALAAAERLLVPAEKQFLRTLVTHHL